MGLWQGISARPVSIAASPRWCDHGPTVYQARAARPRRPCQVTSHPIQLCVCTRTGPAPPLPPPLLWPAEPPAPHRVRCLRAKGFFYEPCSPAACPARGQLSPRPVPWSPAHPNNPRLLGPWPRAALKFTRHERSSRIAWRAWCWRGATKKPAGSLLPPLWARRPHLSTAVY